MTVIHNGEELATTTVASFPSSQQVSWWAVREYFISLTEEIKDWPKAGTPAWCALDHSDPRKLAAVLDAGQHHTLRIETAQEELAQASHDVAAAADWPTIAREIHHRNMFRATRPWMRKAS